MFRDLCSVRIFILPHRFRLRLVSLFDLVLSLEFAISSFLSRTILVSNLVPLRLLLPLVLSVVFALYSSRYPQCLLYNIVDTL
jgi:hypothetical protein